MKAILLASMLLGATATAQQLGAAGQFGNAPQPQASAMDAADTEMLAQPASEGSLKEWYARQKRPALVVYFDRKLDNMPPGWQGSHRLLIENVVAGGGEDKSQRITVGVQQNTQAASAWRNDFATLFEQSLQSEMKRQDFQVLDAVVLHRKEASATRGEGKDIEYESLRKSARLVFEVQFAFVNGQPELVGGLKDIHTGEIAASVRMSVDSALDSAGEIDRVTRSLVRRLLQSRAG